MHQRTQKTLSCFTSVHTRTICAQFYKEYIGNSFSLENRKINSTVFFPGFKELDNFPKIIGIIMVHKIIYLLKLKLWHTLKNDQLMKILLVKIPLKKIRAVGIRAITEWDFFLPG